MKKNSFYTIGSLIILLICAFVFVILPAFTGRSSSQDKIPAFGKYDGKEIRYEQGSDMADFVSTYGQMYQSYGQQIDSSTYYYIFNYAFNSTVTQMAYKNAVAKSGYSVPKTAVNRSMVPYFSDENGNYSSKLYRQTPEKEIQNIRSKVESRLTASRYFDDIFGSETDVLGKEALYGIKESDAEMDFLSSFGNEKRGFEAAIFNQNDFPAEKAVEFGKENSAKFVKYDMSIITCTDKAAAEKLLKRIQNGEITFADAVSEYSEKDYSNTEGKLNNSLQYQIENILTDKADIAKLAALEEGKDSDIIQTEIGYSIFHADGKTSEPDFADETTSQNVMSYLKNYERSVIENYYIAKAEELIKNAGTSDFENACESQGITKKDIEAFPLNYGNLALASTLNTSDSGLTGADTNEEFLKTAFSLKMNELSKPLVIGNSVAVLKYTKDETEENKEASSIGSNITNFDEGSVQSAILDSPKLDNDFATVYFKYFMN